MAIKNISLKAFALWELLVVVIIIGVMAAIAIPQYGNYIPLAIVAEGVVLARPLRQEIEKYFLMHNNLPDNEDCSILQLPQVAGSKYVKEVGLLDDCRIVIKYDTRGVDISTGLFSSIDFTNKTLEIVPSVVDGIVHWDECSMGSIPNRFRSSECW